ncbi:MAG: pyruvate kinase [Phycisphaerae bacterium]
MTSTDASLINTQCRSKIVATLGPASNTEESIRELFEAGVNVCRLNFSHGTHAQHAATLKIVRALASELDRPIAVLGDLCGPKIRLNKVPAGAVLRTGQSVRIVRGDADATAETLTITYPRFVDEVRVGNRVYIDDGLVRLLVVDRSQDEVVCTCTVGGPISTRKGVNLPDSQLSVSALTEKDREDAAWAVEHQLDYLALSFARHPSDLQELKSLLDSLGDAIPVIIKIEKAEAIEHLDAFVKQADGIMIARGDLGVEMDLWEVPLMQKRITQRCREFGKPVIVATQMLQSMVSNPSPTRAEVSDVANAIFDGTDAVMLSAESASGEYPSHAVNMMTRIARSTEAYLDTQAPATVPVMLNEDHPVTSSIALGAARMAQHLRARLVAVWSASGTTVRLIAQYRLRMPVIGLTSDAQIHRRMALYFGVTPIQVPAISNPAEMAARLDAILLERGLAKLNDLIVVVTSTRPHHVGTTDTTLVHRVGEAVSPS